MTRFKFNEQLSSADFMNVMVAYRNYVKKYDLLIIKWELFKFDVFEKPIFQRGAIYGMYFLSEKLGKISLVEAKELIK